MWIASFCIFYMIKEQNITRLSDCEKHIRTYWMTGIHILLFRRPIRLRTVNIPTCLYIFFDAFSAYLKKKLQAGTRKSCRKSVHPWKLKGQASTNENISKIWDMVNTSTLSNHDKYKYFTVYFLIPAYSFNPKAAFWAILENRTWKNGPRTETESAPEGTPSLIFLFLLHHWISIIY